MNFTGCAKGAPSGFTGNDAASGSGLDSGGLSLGSDSGPCGPRCSADLHDILGCDGSIVRTCPPTEGCSPDGKCLPACESATVNKSTVGCDYYSVDPATDGEANGSCFAAYIANTWSGPVKLGLDYAGTSIPLDNLAVTPSGSGASLTYSPLVGGMLPAGQLAILFLNDSPVSSALFHVGCPAGVTAAVTDMPTSSEVTTILNASFHITSSAPVVAYDIFPYGGASASITSATLLVPTSAWGTNYLAVDSFAVSEISAPDAQPFIQIAANQDDTQVTLSPTAAIVGGSGVAPAAMGVPVTYTLNSGQVLQLEQRAELNGTPIQSNKPVGVWGGNSCMTINLGDKACDSGHQELFPISALGYEYAAVRYRPRDPAYPGEAPPWRIMGSTDGTTLTYDPPRPPPGAPTTLDSGELVVFYSPGPFVVKSQDNEHPFYMAAHMGGQNFGGGLSLSPDGGTRYPSGDPEHVNIVPPQQYLTGYVFMTDPTYGNTNLVLVRQKTKGLFEDVELDCLSGPVPTWNPIGTSGDYEYAWVDLVVDGAGQGACKNGYHTMTSKAPFGLTVWGWDQFVSYAYPAGASVRPINAVVVPPAPK
jgi:IgGFc binding protein